MAMKGESGKNLEDAFFLKEDERLLAKLREMKKMKETREALGTVSGIKNERVLQRLVELQIKPEIVAALAAVPLIEVAWADGEVDLKEKQAVLTALDSRGIRPGSIEFELLERWLEHRPEPSLFEAWRHYIEGLRDELSAEDRRELSEVLLRETRGIAESAGGVLGLRKVSAEEAAVLRRLETVLMQS